MERGGEREGRGREEREMKEGGGEGEEGRAEMGEVERNIMEECSSDRQVNLHRHV